MRTAVPAFMLAALAALAGYGYLLRQTPESVLIPCADPVAGCAFSHQGRPARLVFSARPTPLEAFTVRIEAPGMQAAQAEFQMIGMDMGFNRYDFRSAEGGFEARVTLPVCVSGRRDWVMQLTLDGVPYRLEFASR